MSNADRDIIRSLYRNKMNTSSVFYLCPSCFYASETLDEGHEHARLRVEPGMPGDERRKPLTDQQGHILSRAPRWIHEAINESRTASHNSV